VKIAFVIQRYGKEVLGGSEYECRQIAELLIKNHQIEVITTCAKDYTTWKNDYHPGQEVVNKVLINRFPSIAEREMNEFNQFSEWIYYNEHNEKDELKWLEMQGPYCPGLIAYLKAHQDSYDLFFFFTYLYYPTYWGLKEVGYKSILQPLAHHEPAIFLNIFKQVFSLPKALIFNAKAEAAFVEKNFDIQNKQKAIIGGGINLPKRSFSNQFNKKYNLDKKFILCAGRIDPGKGCQELCEFFIKYRQTSPPLKLVFIGHLLMELPKHSDIQYLGFLSEKEKLAVMNAASVVVIPSPLESLSFTLLEAFSVKTPVLVNAHSEVLKEHCLQSNGGLFYSDYHEFAHSLELLLQQDKNHILGMQGYNYAKNNYHWPIIAEKYLNFIEKV
jgi:glycosyltransferase involved in cell wall biosynthesis